MPLFDEPWAILPGHLRTMAARAEQYTLDEQTKAEARAAELRARETPRLQGVAVVSIHGPIFHKNAAAAAWYGGITSLEVVERVTAAIRDPNVKAVLLDIDSPGGEAAGTQEAAAAVAALRGGKPIVAVANSLAASAAYWIGAAADKFVTMNSGMVGSIGVILVHADVSGFWGRLGVKTTVLRAGKFKALGHSLEALDETGKAALQENLDFRYGEFIQAVATMRKLDLAHASSWAEGRVFVGRTALAAGLADRVGTFSELLFELQNGGATGAAAKVSLEGAEVADETKPAVSETKPAQAETIAAGVSQAVDLAASIEAERKRGLTIKSLCESAGHAGEATRLIQSGATIEATREFLLDKLCQTRQAVGDNGGGPTDKPADPDAAFRAEYRADAKTFAKLGVSEAEYLASRQMSTAA